MSESVYINANATPRVKKVNEEADDIINGQRQTDYGTPSASFGRIADLWSTYLGKPITAEDIVNMMILLKVSRAKQGYHRDSYVDIAGYAGCAELLQLDRANLPL